MAWIRPMFDYGVSVFIHVQMYGEGELHEYYKSIMMLFL